MSATELALNTSSRIRFDQFLRLTFKRLESGDSGHYACFVDFKATVDYFVTGNLCVFLDLNVHVHSLFFSV